MTKPKTTTAPANEPISAQLIQPASSSRPAANATRQRQKASTPRISATMINPSRSLSESSPIPTAVSSVANGLP